MKWPTGENNIDLPLKKAVLLIAFTHCTGFFYIVHVWGVVCAHVCTSIKKSGIYVPLVCFLGCSFGGHRIGGSVNCFFRYNTRVLLHWSCLVHFNLTFERLVIWSFCLGWCEKLIQTLVQTKQPNFSLPENVGLGFGSKCTRVQFTLDTDQI